MSGRRKINWKPLITKQPKIKMRRNRTAIMRLSHEGGGRFAIGIAFKGRRAIVGEFKLDRLFLADVLMSQIRNRIANTGFKVIIA